MRRTQLTATQRCMLQAQERRLRLIVPQPRQRAARRIVPLVQRVRL